MYTRISVLTKASPISSKDTVILSCVCKIILTFFILVLQPSSGQSELTLQPQSLDDVIIPQGRGMSSPDIKEEDISIISSDIDSDDISEHQASNVFSPTWGRYKKLLNLFWEDLSASLTLIYNFRF